MEPEMSRMDSVEEPPSQASRFIAKVVPGILQRAFPDASLEHLYQSYRGKQKKLDILSFYLAFLLFNVFVTSTAVYGDESTWHLGLLWTSVSITLVGFLLVATIAVIFILVQRKNVQIDFLEQVWMALPYLGWVLATGLLLISLLLARHTHVTPREYLGFAMVINFLIYTSLPLRLRYCLLLSLTMCICYLATASILGRKDHQLSQQIFSNSLLLIATSFIGLTSYFLSDKQQRRAFLETRQSLEVKLLIEEQSAEQERLLLSVLPEHVAVQMRQDMGTAIDSQFKKIYMSRHENVSILYADIVGFTAISSTYSASELVKILNELFARFDNLADKYHQLRIKILGDCYYCISGAPQERPDHAILCVHMGLSMVEAIKYVQNTTNSPVDMRVGIHTGAVLAGVLGQRQWQFDVYSKDVELANKMESSGKAGRVHISEKTLSYLDDHFEVEPAHGEKREETLRMAGLKTFFIVKALKPFEEEQDMRNGTSNEETNVEDNHGASLEPVGIRVSNCERIRENSQDFRRRLRQDLLNRERDRAVEKQITPCTLQFYDDAKEKAYRAHKASFPSASTMAFPVAGFVIATTHFLILPWTIASTIYSLVMLNVLLILSFIYMVEAFPSELPPVLVKLSSKFSCDYRRRFLSAFLSALLLSGVVLFMDLVCESIGSVNFNATSDALAISSEGNMTQWSPDCHCYFPSYLAYFVVLVNFAITLSAFLPTWAKIAVMLVLFIIQSLLYALGDLGRLLDAERKIAYYHDNDLQPFSDKIGLLYLMGITLIVLFTVNFFSEKTSRVLFIWRLTVEEQREKAADMRLRNESLVYNILPPHVAAHFLRPGAPRRHDELYSQSYAEVGVLFASMPNFSDFYTEESVNNQGLECLRFLNEVISDFDAILERPQFKEMIIKIKTIGSTYMAASGLNTNQENQAESEKSSSIWNHLALLVDFAFELKKALTSINEQSFNHFVLKMGINHGPITAGVIGARKPHYDIWGNSVNVASRMESTGKAGCIQVTEETCEILKQFGYQFEQRGLVSVKGKGQLMTYYLTGKGEPPSSGGGQEPPGEVLSTDQISIDPSSVGDLSDGSNLKCAISANSATHLLPTPNEE
ncbi:adenylate cyclase type 3-like [Neocloeon triangulifer]|uniref:adenylate cyclase type 3-like n=1 Tax=Neocloeon triangulifer TaxID=2078957 RepID=UPI00286EF2C7|nr:adenylate cyclase type 3-like [Neocloeon triangulifer]XP_059484470.1 adenylate cyclase type 3-like [Neocloeon triangulifer]